MPTNANAYNSRLTDESLEKRFRDTFRSQGGAELVDDLYASGVIVPVVDFTAAAEGSQLGQNLQTAWDFSTGFTNIGTATTVNLVTTSGFWQVDCNAVLGSSALNAEMYISITDGLTSKKIWQMRGNNAEGATASEDRFVVFLRSGDSLTGTASATTVSLSVWYRQIADVSGNLVNPTGFTSS